MWTELLYVRNPIEAGIVRRVSYETKKKIVFVFMFRSFETRFSYHRALGSIYKLGKVKMKNNFIFDIFAFHFSALTTAVKTMPQKNQTFSFEFLHSSFQNGNQHRTEPAATDKLKIIIQNKT